MKYVCAHCFRELEMVEGALVECPEHPDGQVVGVEDDTQS
jgi:hypothetical protein